MVLWQALVIGALQGISELFPVSSLAHTILIPALLNWGINQAAGDFLAFVVALHLATAIALLIFFWKDWVTVILALLESVRHRNLVYSKDSKFAWLLIIGTLFVGIIGLVFENLLRKLFEDSGYFWIVAVLLILNGGVMIYGEYLRRKVGKRKSGEYKKVEDLSFIQGGVVGATQTLALLPGISRSGVTMVGGLLAGLSHEEAARFSFMLATPVIGLAALLKLPQLFKPEAHDILGTTVAAALVAGITAYLSVKFLMRYFESQRLSPFGYYCMGFGLFALVVLLVRG